MFPAPNCVQTVKTLLKCRLTVCKLVGPHLKHSNIKLKYTLLRQKNNRDSNKNLHYLEEIFYKCIEKNKISSIIEIPNLN